MEVSGEDYRVFYNSTTATVACQGSLRLYGTAGYSDIAELLNTVADQNPAILILDVRQLEFLNSSGLNTISKFIIRVRNNNVSKLIIKGTRQIPWQSKTLGSLQRLMTDLKVELE